VEQSRLGVAPAVTRRVGTEKRWLDQRGPIHISHATQGLIVGPDYLRVLLAHGPPSLSRDQGHGRKAKGGLRKAPFACVIRSPFTPLLALGRERAVCAAESNNPLHCTTPCIAQPLHCCSRSGAFSASTRIASARTSGLRGSTVPSTGKPSVTARGSACPRSELRAFQRSLPPRRTSQRARSPGRS
jgi:hypothetical protein